MQSCWTRYHHLQNININDSILEHVSEISVQVFNWSQQEAESYINCALNFKDKLKFMKSASLGAVVLSLNGLIGNLSLFLPNFNALITLNVENKRQRDAYHLPQFCMFSIMRS